jgi:class 3 adenylate cyclase
MRNAIQPTGCPTCFDGADMTDVSDADQNAAPSIERAIEHVIAREILSNELKVAYVKVIVVFMASILDIFLYINPHLVGIEQAPISIPLISTAACIIYTGFLIALSRPSALRWLPKLQIAIPLFDSLVLALFITNMSIVIGETHPHVIANVTAFCCIFAISGSIRIQKRASQLTTLLAVLNFGYAILLFNISLGLAMFALLVIMGCGLMGLLTSRIVHRQIQNETGRLLMEQFLPTNVVEAAFETPTQMIGKPTNYEVTVMMTDLRGFTKHAEKLKPAELFDFLNQFQSSLTTVVNRNGGWVNSFMGDGMLAVFGAPNISERHAGQALQAAKEILVEVQPQCPLPMGIGLHSGTIVAGYLGTEGHLEFATIGDTVNVTSRLEALTKEVDHALLISESTEAFLKSYNLKPLGKMPIRGRNEQIGVFTLS